jgi:hypothetical protein
VSDSDSFIDEVAEEVRRDRLFALMRKYGWIGVLIVALIVGGAAFNEYRKARAEASAEAFGDVILAALVSDKADARVAELAKISPGDAPGRAAVLGFMTAAEAESAGNRDASLAALGAIADNASVPANYRQLARLKTVILAGDTLDPAERDSILADLAAPGGPYRALAMEQQALALLSQSKNDEAADLLGKIVQDADATTALQGRVQQLLVALGKPAPGN